MSCDEDWTKLATRDQAGRSNPKLPATKLGGRLADLPLRCAGQQQRDDRRNDHGEPLDELQPSSLSPPHGGRDIGSMALPQMGSKSAQGVLQ